MSNEILKQLQQDKLDTQVFIDKAVKLEKLKTNTLFKEIFLKDYCEADVTRLVGALSNVEEETKKRVFAELEAISRFKSHMGFIEQMGHAAKAKIAEIDEAISDEMKEA